MVVIIIYLSSLSRLPNLPIAEFGSRSDQSTYTRLETVKCNWGIAIVYYYYFIVYHYCYMLIIILLLYIIIII